MAVEISSFRGENSWVADLARQTFQAIFFNDPYAPEMPVLAMKPLLIKQCANLLQSKK